MMKFQVAALFRKATSDTSYSVPWLLVRNLVPGGWLLSVMMLRMETILAFGVIIGTGRNGAGQYKKHQPASPASRT